MDAQLAGAVERIKAATAGRPIRLSIIGATGRVGAEMLELVAASPASFKLVALTCNQEIGRLGGLARAFGAEFVAAADGEGFSHLRDMLRNTGVAPGGGDKAIIEAARLPADLVLIGVPGMAGVAPAFAAAATAATVVIADPRVVVSGGGHLITAARQGGASVKLLSPRAASAIAMSGTARVTLADDGGQAALIPGLVHEAMAVALLSGREPPLIDIASGAPGAFVERAPSFWQALPIVDRRERLLQLIEAAALAAVPPRSGPRPDPAMPLQFDPLDQAAQAVLTSARAAIRAGGSMPAAWCGGFDMVSAVLAEGRIDDHDVAAVVAEIVARMGPELAGLDASGGFAAVEAADLAARMMAYELLEEWR